jgi:hypothetical protein
MASLDAVGAFLVRLPVDLFTKLRFLTSEPWEKSFTVSGNKVSAVNLRDIRTNKSSWSRILGTNQHAAESLGD